MESEGTPNEPVSVQPTTESATEDLSVAPPDPIATSVKRRIRRTPGLIAVFVVLVAAGIVAATTFVAGASRRPDGVVNADRTALYTVVRQDLSSQTQLSATLGYAGSYPVVNQAQGIVTSLPSIGQVVRQGQILYAVNGAPVVLLYGSTPAYRTLSVGMSGADVIQLNADLVSLGYATRNELEPSSNYFSTATAVALEGLQAALGVTENGTLSLGQAVYAPTAVRVSSVKANLGASAQPSQPVMEATSTTRQISIALGASQQSEVAVGDKVTITLPNDQSTDGVISSVGSVATAPESGSLSTSPTITVLVNPTDAASTGTWDQAPVSVTITASSATNALVVPVDALLAQASGNYAVEVAGAHNNHHLVTVSLGLFDDADGLVQVTKTNLVAGERVVVPNL